MLIQSIVYNIFIEEKWQFNGAGRKYLSIDISDLQKLHHLIKVHFYGVIIIKKLQVII